MTVEVNLKNIGKINIENGLTLYELAREYGGICKFDIMAAIVNNELTELNKRITSPCDIELIDITNPNGFKVYQRSVVFLMICAAIEILGKQARIVVEHSINKNYYCEYINESGETQSLSDETLTLIENRMTEYVNKEINIEKFNIPLEEGIKLAEENGLPDKVKFLKYRRTSSVNFYKLGWFYDYFYGQMAVNTKMLSVFKLVRELDGFILQFSSRYEAGELEQIKTLNKISNVFRESNKWTKILKADTVGALNDIICSGGQGNFIRTNEALHEKKLAEIADMIYERGVSVVLIAGPSSSGKTTFAARLSVHLMVNGLKPNVLSLDNYYVDRDKTPRDESGQLDFEDINALDINRIDEDISRLSRGELVRTPLYNFITGKREISTRTLLLEKNDVLIIEGIHGLNEIISKSIPKENKFKIFISALTQLNIDDHNRIATTDTRLIRRIVRDHKFRGFGAKGTIGMWSSVGRGESKHIFPFQEEADIIFNSALVYEMCVLKQYAEPLLFEIDKTEPEYIEAKRLIKFLDSFMGIPSEEVPNNSILREFIGGSCFRT